MNRTAVALSRASRRVRNKPIECLEHFDPFDYFRITNLIKPFLAYGFNHAP
jgi:hypothetical protein